MTAIAELNENLERLSNHLAAVRARSAAARLDVATVLHLLVVDKRSQNKALVQRAFSEAGRQLHLNLPGFENDTLPRKVRGVDLRMVIRPVWDGLTEPPEPGVHREPAYEPRVVGLEQFLLQECVWQHGVWADEAASLSVERVIKTCRDKAGSHSDPVKKAWMSDFRAYIVGDSDLLTWILWSIGEAVMEAITNALADAGLATSRYQRVKSLNGIVIGQIEFPVLRRIGETPVTCFFHLESLTPAPRAIFGFVADETPFLIGVGNHNHLVAKAGRARQALESIYIEFLAGM